MEVRWNSADWIQAAGERQVQFSALLIGITFAVFLMMQMTAMFAGILNRAYSNVT